MRGKQRKKITDSKNGRSLFGRSLVGAIAALTAAGVSPAVGQDRIEILGLYGYSFSEGVEVARATVGSQFIDKVDVGSGVSYGGAVNFWVDDQIQAGVLFDLQDGSLILNGSSEQEVTDMKVYTYHGVITYHTGTSGSVVRPFFMFGLGATQYQPSDVSGFSFDGEVRFSGTMGGGVKAYVNERVGLVFTGRWTPTYIKSDVGGVWCSPYWSPWYGSSCAVMADPDYSNQFELSAGIILRL